MDTPGVNGIVVVMRDVTERRRAEEALRVSEERFRTLATATANVVWHCNAAGESIGDVPTWRAFTGQGIADMRGYGWAHAIHPDDVERMQQAWARAATAREVFSPELRIRRHDGQYRDFAIRGVPIQDAGGVIREWMGTCVDVTERKQAEVQLQWKTTLLEAQVNASLDGILVVDGNGRTILQNQRLVGLFHIPPHLADDADDSKRVQWVANSVEDPARFIAVVAHLYSHPAEVSHDEVALKDGTILERYSAPVLGKDGTHHGRIWTFHDITERKRAEEVLLQANRELKVLGERNQIAAAVIQSAAEGVMVTDAELHIESVNPSFERITGYSAAEAVGKSPKILFSGKHDDGFFHQLHGQVDAQGRWHGEIWNRRRDGELYSQETSINILRNPEGYISHYASVFSDNTSRNLLEARLRELSSVDGLTGIANRRTFDEILAREWGRALRDQSPLSLLMVDIDHFKAYNDRHGHPGGDACLQQVARAMQGAANRASDVVARYGGEEFAVILPATEAASAAGAAEKMRASIVALALPHGGSDAAAVVTISVGAMTVVPSRSVRQEELVAAADRALYEAKHTGRNRVVCAAPPSGAASGVTGEAA